MRNDKEVKEVLVKESLLEDIAENMRKSVALMKRENTLKER